jgi:ethanolamine utilization protein EutA
MFTDRFAALIIDLILGVPSPLLDELALTLPSRPRHPSTRPSVFLSGGVGRCYYDGTARRHHRRDRCRSVTSGPCSPESLRLEPRLRAMDVRQPAQTLNATVIGAASQTVTISGTTIWVRADLLPLRDLPVVQPAARRLAKRHRGDWPTAVRLATRRWDADGDGRVAIALALPDTLDYSGLSSIAAALADYATATRCPRDVPLVVVTEEDYAQVLGQTVQCTSAGPARDHDRPDRSG